MSVTTATNAESPMNITELPEELLVKIIECLAEVRELRRVRIAQRLDRPNSEYDKNKYLSRLSKINRLFYRLTTERLYSKYTEQPKPQLYLRTLLSKPHLASHLKDVDFTFRVSNLHTTSFILAAETACTTQDYDNMKLHLGLDFLKQFQQAYPTTQDIEAIEDDPPSTSIPSESECEEQDAALLKLETTVELVQAAILILAQNISTLKMNITPSHNGDSLCPQWLELVSGRVCHKNLTKLHTLHLDTFLVVVWRRSIDIGDLAPVFRMDTLRSLHLSALREPSILGSAERQSLRQAIPIGSNRIEEMKFKEGFVCMEMLAVLVGSSRRLKKLALNYNNLGGGSEDNKWSSKMGKTTLIEALEVHKATLEEISLKWTDKVSELTKMSDVKWYRQYPSLSEFTALKRLNCPSHALVGKGESYSYQALPQMLEVLQLNQVDLRDDEAFLKQVAFYHSKTEH